MLEQQELVKTVDLMLRCTGYRLLGESLRSDLTTDYGPTGWIIRARPWGICWRPDNIVYEFIDEHSSANKNGVFWWDGDDLNFVVVSNFVSAHGPWYEQLPVLQMSYDTAKNTAWFFFRMHAVIGKVDENKQFKANRFPVLMKISDKDEVDVEEYAKTLLDNHYDPEMTAEALEKEIRRDRGEKFGLPEIIHFLRERRML